MNITGNLFKTIKSRELIEITEDFFLSLKSGLTILEAVETAKENSFNKEICKRWEDFGNLLKGGEKIHLAWSKVFFEEGEKSGNILRMYEESGDVSKGFQMISIYYKEKEIYRKSILKTLYYPLFVLLLAGITFIWFINYFIPSVLIMTEDILSTEDFIKISGIFYKIRLGVNTLAIITSLFAFYFIAAKNGRKKILKKLYFLRFLRKVINLFQLESFSHYVCYLLNCGFPLMKTLDILKKDTSLNISKEETEKCIKLLEDGQPLSCSLQAYDFIGKREFEIIRKGEMRGTLSESFFSINSYTKNKKDRYLKDSISFLEPIFILASGAITGVSVYIFYKLIFTYTFTLF